jgi:hypothetical protein
MTTTPPFPRWRERGLVPGLTLDNRTTNNFAVDSRQWYFDRYQHNTHPFQTGAFNNHIFIKMSATGMPKKLQFGPSSTKDASLFLDCFQGQSTENIGTNG